MSDITFEESCPCGTAIKVFGWRTAVEDQIKSWRSIHIKHANAMVKKMSLESPKPSAKEDDKRTE